MKLTIINTHDKTAEYQACLAYAKWQCSHVEKQYEEFGVVYKMTQGKMDTIILLDGELIAKGFEEFYNYWKANGLSRC